MESNSRIPLPSPSPLFVDTNAFNFSATPQPTPLNFTSTPFTFPSTPASQNDGIPSGTTNTTSSTTTNLSETNTTTTSTTTNLTPSAPTPQTQQESFQEQYQYQKSPQTRKENEKSSTNDVMETTDQEPESVKKNKKKAIESIPHLKDTRKVLQVEREFAQLTPIFGQQDEYSLYSPKPEMDGIKLLLLAKENDSKATSSNFETTQSSLITISNQSNLIRPDGMKIRSLSSENVNDTDGEDEQERREIEELKSKKPTELTADEKKKLFLYRNKIAASKCRQKKKQWIRDLESQKTASLDRRMKLIETLKTQLSQFSSDIDKINSRIETNPALKNYMMENSQRLFSIKNSALTLVNQLVSQGPP